MMASRKKPKVALIDAHALIHRAYHALPPMSTKQGQPTNAAFGFTTMLLKMLTTVKPTHVVAAFDVKGKTFRHEQFAEYKAHRKALDDDLVVQFNTVREVVRAFNIPIIEKKGFEADDIIGTLTEQLTGTTETVIVTGDADTFQLIDDDTSVFTLQRGVTDTISYDAEKVREKYGFGPELVVDYKGLAGDSSDNIPGVEGVGDKTAKELIRKYGSIEQIYEYLEELPTRAKNRLTGHKKDALFSRKLATIKRNVPLQFALADAELADYDVEAVQALLERLEFRSLLQKLPKSSRGATKQLSLLGGAEKQKKLPAMPRRYHLVDSPEEVKALQARLAKEKVIAFDTETDGLGGRTAPIVGMSFAIEGSKAGEPDAWYVPVDTESVKEWQGLLENRKAGKVGHNIKYDAEVLGQSGITLGPIVFDTMVASYLLDPGSRQHKLDTLALTELGHRMIPITDLIGTGKEQTTVKAVPLRDLAHYACEDADITWQLYKVLEKRIAKEDLQRVLEEIEMPLIPILVALETTGVAVDVALLGELQKKVARRLQTLVKKIHAAAGTVFNINSTQQLRAVLYETLRLPTEGIARTQSGYSTAASELEKLRGEHEIIPLLEEYRELAKLQNTYIETLPELVDEQTGRIYAEFNQVVAATGRISSQNPNLQNIPVRTELGQEIRSAFVAPRGRRLVKADYSQIELRIAAHISQDEKMLAAFAAGEDIHAATAAAIHGVAVGDVTAGQRRDAKTLNFGVLYGMGPGKFAAETGVSMEEGRSFIERYREEYAGITALIDETVRQAEEQGYVETLFGRKRYVPEIKARNQRMRAQAERIAFNHPMQGTASDILKKAMIVLQAVIEKQYPDSQMVLTVHDELVCEVPAEHAEEFASVIKKTMEGVATLDVPLEVDVAVGKNWRDVK